MLFRSYSISLFHLPIPSPYSISLFHLPLLSTHSSHPFSPLPSPIPHLPSTHPTPNPPLTSTMNTVRHPPPRHLQIQRLHQPGQGQRRHEHQDPAQHPVESRQLQPPARAADRVLRRRAGAGCFGCVVELFSFPFFLSFFPFLFFDLHPCLCLYFFISFHSYFGFLYFLMASGARFLPSVPCWCIPLSHFSHFSPFAPFAPSFLPQLPPEIPVPLV